MYIKPACAVNHRQIVSTQPGNASLMTMLNVYAGVVCADLTALKNPTGPITPRRFSNGKFLMTLFADSQRYPDMHGFEMRDPVSES